MTTPDILQMSLDAKALKFVSEFFEKERLDGIRPKTASRPSDSVQLER